MYEISDRDGAKGASGHREASQKVIKAGEHLRDVYGINDVVVIKNQRQSRNNRLPSQYSDEGDKQQADLMTSYDHKKYGTTK